MDMRLEQTTFEAEIPCGSCKTRFTVEGDVTLPGSLRETTNILHASAMAVVESAEASQDRATIAGRVIFCVLYTQGDHGTPESIEAAADFTHLCDMPGAVPRSAVDAWAQAEHVTASVQNGRVSMKAVLSLCARAVCTQTAEALSAAKGDFVQQKTDQITLRRKTASGSADTLLREEFSLPADLAVTETLAAWADVQMLDATGGQGRIGLSGEVTLTVAHASSQPGRPLIMTRHTIPVGESVEVAGDGGDMLRGRIRVKDVAVASQDLGDGERTLRAEVLQEGRAVHSVKARAPNPAVKRRKRDAFHGGMPENVHILRPYFRFVGAVRPAEIVVAGADKHRHAHFLQGGIHRLVAFFGIGTVEQVACQKQKIAAFPLAQGGDHVGDLQQRGAQISGMLPGLSHQGRVQVPVSAVQDLHRKYPPFLPFCKGRYWYRW